MYDCLVIGAGPAGATAAYNLAKQGKSVVVIDKDNFPRHKSCGGGVSPAIAKWFDCDFSPVVSNTVSQVKYTWKLGDPVEIDLEGVTPMWMVNRAQFDNFLIEQAVTQGAEFKPNTTVTGIQLKEQTWQVSTSKGDLRATYLIAADGANGPTADWLGFSPAQKVLAANFEIKAAIAEHRKNMAYFDFGSLKNGFMWMFPKADGYSFSAAFVRDTKGKPQELQKQLTNFAEKFGLSFSEGEYTEYAMNLWQEDRPLHSKQALIVGEAAGIVDPLIGEGIRPAIYTGLKAAEAIAQALAGQDKALASYSNQINQEWGADLAKAASVAGMFYKFPKIAYKVGVKRPTAGQTIGKILSGELRYTDIAEKISQKLKGGFIPGFGK